MRPTISEQLRGMRRVLAEVVAPEVTGAYPADMLRGVLATLEVLERSWTRVAPFLAWDNERTEALLRSIAPHVSRDLAARIDAALVAPPADVLDVDALDARNTDLRALLADAVPALATADATTSAAADGAAAVYAEVRAHLRERVERFPLSASAPMPGSR